MKKILITMLAILLFGAQNAFAKDFADVPQTHWAYDSISLFADQGVISGYEDGSFRPESSVTRGEWAKLMCDALGIRQTGMMGMWGFYISAADMSESDWSAPYMAAVSSYLTHERDSYGQNYYRPNESATREEVASSLVRVLGLSGSGGYSYIGAFSDSGDVSDFERSNMNTAVEYGIISGYEDGTVRPQSPVTRAEAACLLQRTISKAFLMQPHGRETFS